MKTARFAACGLLVALAALSACSSDKHDDEGGQPIAAVPGTESADTAFALPPARALENPSQTLNDFARLESVLAVVKNGDDMAAQQFLAQQNQSAMGESVRNEWLKSLGRRGMAQEFQTQLKLLPADGRSQEVQCYAKLTSGQLGDDAAVRDWQQDTGKLPAGCNALLETQAARGAYPAAAAWRRVRGLLAAGQTTNAGKLAAALGSPLDGGSGQGAQENLLRDIISPNAQRNPTAAAARLEALAGSLNAEQQSFAWGVLGTAQAKNQNMAAALAYYQKAAQPAQFGSEQLEWAVRAALRLQRWDEVARFIGHMPQSLQNDPAWRYWLGRSLAAQGNAAQAQNHYRAAAASGRNFYALLAAEELGQRADARNNVADAQPAQVAAVGKDGAIQRALTLFRSSQQGGNWKMRRQAQNEWRYAVRSFDEPAQLAAAQLAFDNQFYEMAVYSADRTNRLLNYKLRYISPFSDLVRPHAAAVGLDPAWVYGLIRQESRFVIGAQSGVGAQGLMQVMPATAQVIARQTSMSDSELYTMSGNIRMGTWYLSDIRGKLQNSDVLATAGYNAGPGRARKWQAAGSLEGAVYAETIPFNETRDYVKKVMANAVYYAALFGSGNTSLKQRMGRVPGRQ